MCVYSLHNVTGRLTVGKLFQSNDFLAVEREPQWNLWDISLKAIGLGSKSWNFGIAVSVPVELNLIGYTIPRNPSPLRPSSGQRGSRTAEQCELADQWSQWLCGMWRGVLGSVDVSVHIVFGLRPHDEITQLRFVHSHVGVFVLSELFILTCWIISCGRLARSRVAHETKPGTIRNCWRSLCVGSRFLVCFIDAWKGSQLKNGLWSNLDWMFVGSLLFFF